MSEITAIYDSPIGPLHLVATEDYLVSLSFSNDALKDKKTSMLPNKSKKTAELITDCFGQLDTYFSGECRVFHLPFQQPGTEFQQTVWSELVKIAYGKTISYLELSKRIGNPKAIRAVGTTNGKNQLAIIVPCHRVIGTNGELTGYAGGLWRKKWLLDHENKFAHGVQSLF